MFRNLMHAFTESPMQNAAQNTANTGMIGSTLTSSGLQGAIQNSILGHSVQARRTLSKKIFSGNIEVQHVSNGYVVNIGIKDGYEYTTYIAQTITEVNEIIAAAMVAFQLEQ